MRFPLVTTVLCSIVLGFLLVLTMLVLAVCEEAASAEHHPPSRTAFLGRDTKIVLFWTKFYALKHPDLFNDLRYCPVSDCYLTENRKYLEQSAAVVFHAYDLWWRPEQMPWSRTAHQLYIFHYLESPQYIWQLPFNSDPWKDFFNLTWTYRRDSDILATTYLESGDVHLSPAWTVMNRSSVRHNLERKVNKALIFLSHCHTLSGRETYVAELQKYFPVDIIGECGEKSPCRRPADSWFAGDRNCERKTVEPYKFYLAFENRSVKRQQVSGEMPSRLTLGFNKPKSFSSWLTSSFYIHMGHGFSGVHPTIFQFFPASVGVRRLFKKFEVAN